MSHLSMQELAEGIGSMPHSPSETGTVEMIVVRTDEDLRDTPDSAVLSPDFGIEGDHWSRGSYAGLPEMQLSLINRHVIDLLSGDRARWKLAGDNLIVDFDLGVANIPSGARLSIGSAVVEISAKVHRGCSKFASRYGPEARMFVNQGEGPQRRLRGAYATVIEAGEVSVGDTISKM